MDTGGMSAFRCRLRLLGPLTAMLLLPLAAAPSPGASTQDATMIREHHLRSAGGRLDYTSVAGRIPIRGAGTDEVRASMFYVAYTARAKAGERRPLTVIWNGGPGGSMSSMLLGGQGPRLLDAGEVVDNPDTILDATDLLYIDAVGSGFSRLSKPSDAPAFYQTRGDNDAFVECILAWLRRSGQQDRTVFLSGVSWGAYRVAAVAEGLARRGVKVGGGAMMAGRNGLSRPDAERRLLPLWIVNLPRIARLHGRGGAMASRNIDEVESEVGAWARSVYLPALSRLPGLDAVEREAIARRLSLYSGLPLERIDRNRLSVTPRDVMDGLLWEQAVHD
ncbi:MAG: hypothetical protein EOP67_12800, partial [Sphingomonas sp.]